ncbi:MAG TPA: amidohydrolase family protein [Polyangiaceae bacterium]|nr:amidohydrolase family protein [Polyangiaceae bacterium]
MAPSSILFTDVTIFDGIHSEPWPGEVLVRGERIESVSRRAGTLRGDRQIRGGGATLMSGLCDAHTHFSWNDAPSLNHLGTTPPEDHTVFAVKAARTYIDMGYTMCVGASSAKMRLDVVIRDAINDGTIPGPRLLACCTEFSTPEGTLLPGASIVVSGPGEFRAAASEVIELGVDVIKIICSGEEITGTLRANDTYVTEEELAAVVEVAHARGRKVSVHARSTESIKRCLRAGIDFLYHASYIDEEGLDLLEARKDRVFVAPGVNWIITTLHDAAPWGYAPSAAEAAGYARELEACVVGIRAMRSRGIRVLPGGDYGFAWCPHGTYARDLKHFVDLFGYTPAETLRAATVWGGQMMGRPNELGKVAPGYFADLLLVDGNPLSDVTILQDRTRLLAIMKAGQFHKEPARDSPLLLTTRRT